MRSACILGRQPALGLAELESLYGADKLQPIAERAVLVDVDPCLLAFDRLGGSVKFCKLLTVLDTTDWKQIEKFLLEVSPGHSEQMPAGKMHLGLSVTGIATTVLQLSATALKLKKAIRKTGRSVHVIPNKTLELSSAQVFHNKLTSPTGWELIFICKDNQTYVVQTVKVQDIDAYAARDQARPKRDARVGMLPPKLAQIIVNLAVGELPAEAKQSVCEIPPDQPIPPAHFESFRLLDPFCGSGVIPQEALLMGYPAVGTDIDPRMVEFTNQNLAWLKQQYASLPEFEVMAADACETQWQSFNSVATETYLGRPFSARPAPDILRQVVSDVNTIHKKFLQNLARQTKPGFRMCMAVPAWKADNGFQHLPILDHLTDMGYTRASFVHASNEDLIYHREGQIVGRELVVLIRK